MDYCVCFKVDGHVSKVDGELPWKAQSTPFGMVAYSDTPQGAAERLLLMVKILTIRVKQLPELLSKNNIPFVIKPRVFYFDVYQPTELQRLSYRYRDPSDAYIFHILVETHRND